MDEFIFNSEVYNIVRQIPSGSVISYGQIAALLGKPTHSRMVGRAMRNAPKELFLPCHRVLNSSGRTAPGWIQQKILLQNEGVEFKKNGLVDMKKYGWKEVIL